MTLCDPFEIGWWMHSTDETVYGPVSRQTLKTFLQSGVITPNTLVRHCTQTGFKAVADVPQIIDGVDINPAAPAYGDRLAEAWPRRKRDRRALAESSIPCAWRKRPAVLICWRCQAPYSEKYRMKPFRKQFYLCKKCQGSNFNRRTVAYLIDIFLMWAVMMAAIIPLTLALTAAPDAGAQNADSPDVRAALAIYGVQFVLAVAFVFRDSWLRGSGPGKIVTRLRAVRHDDGLTALGSGQAFIRWFPLAVPFLNLADIIVAYRDPALRRFGDRWAGTRVIDSDVTVSRARRKVQRRLEKKGVRLEPALATTMDEFARIPV